MVLFICSTLLQAYTTELELKVAMLVEENAKLRKQQERVSTVEEEFLGSSSCSATKKAHPLSNLNSSILRKPKNTKPSLRKNINLRALDEKFKFYETSKKRNKGNRYLILGHMGDYAQCLATSKDDEKYNSLDHQIFS
ncbi:hypothetical protein SADUNF_Sadunf02G0015300 [Salix dunnii]|uniref:Uncharacterized protein n=1 Tax=Salix dunnii TaxID=1413687 RepID=A0A835TI30_9ROSI|nr:hypothetical protein SADUNF_Sadunf02G0015300 [Salix dunnii]